MPDQSWDVLGRIFALQGDTLQGMTTVPNGLGIALVIVLLAGISQGIGQSIVLFLNQVKPGRFGLSLFINALLFTAGFLALGLSTWLMTLRPGATLVSPQDLTIVLGLAYAPLLFSFLGALPYLGLPIVNLLAIWHLLAMVVGFGALVNQPIGVAVRYVMLGWVLLQVLQNTVGRPIANLGKAVANRAAGVELITSRRETPHPCSATSTMSLVGGARHLTNALRP